MCSAFACNSNHSAHYGCIAAGHACVTLQTVTQPFIVPWHVQVVCKVATDVLTHVTTSSWLKAKLAAVPSNKFGLDGSFQPDVPHAALYLLLSNLKNEQDVRYAGKRIVGLCADVLVKDANDKQHSGCLGATASLMLLGDATVALACFAATCYVVINWNAAQQALCLQTALTSELCHSGWFL